MPKQKFEVGRLEEAAQLLHSTKLQEELLVRFTYLYRERVAEIEFAAAPDTQRGPSTWRDVEHTEQVIVPKGDTLLRMLVALMIEARLEGRRATTLVGASWRRVMQLLGVEQLTRKAARHASREQLQLLGVPVEEDEEMPEDRLLVAFGYETEAPDTAYVLILEDSDAY